MPIILLDWAAKDSRTLTPLDGTNHFLEAVFRKGLIINVPALNPFGGTALEDVRTIFSPFYKTTNPHILLSTTVFFGGFNKQQPKMTYEPRCCLKMIFSKK